MRSRAELLEIILDDTHALWCKSFVDEVNEAFGTAVACRDYASDVGNGPKGLTLNDGESETMGLACFHLAPALCDALGVGYKRFLGRGFQVRACVAALREAGYGVEG